MSKLITYSTLFLFILYFITGINSVSFTLEFITNNFTSNYGITIIIITILVRSLMLPINLEFVKNQQNNKSNPLMKDISELSKKMIFEKDNEKRKNMQLEINKMYKDNDINPLSGNPLSLIIQALVVSSLYFTINASNEIRNQEFLWFGLATSDIYLTIITSLTYLVGSFINMKNSEIPKSMKFIPLIIPIIMFIVVTNASSALGIYFFVSSIFTIFQTVLFKYIRKLRIQESWLEGVKFPSFIKDINKCKY